ncbi:MAG: hypothetical protein NWF05_03710 [Candidatus Bathyarchaeota archaeon]|nr:hypothetical protein [Candidatus Bathyarchaeota archaeon]
MPETRINLLRNSWSDCDAAIDAIGMKTNEYAQQKMGRKKWSDVTGFLKSIDFINSDGLTEMGGDYYKSRFILHDKELSTKILATTIKKYLPTQAICQLLWGRPNLNKESIYRLLVHNDYISSKEFKEPDIGGFLMLLNQCGIIKYNKKGNSIAVLYNPRTGAEFEISTKFLSPETPYSNIRNLRDILRDSKGFVHWFDKHFSIKGFEPLHDEADGIKINEIKVLSGVTSQRVNNRLRDEFIRFKKEMETRQISAELRIICDKTILNEIHDRWIVSESAVFNVPPIDTIFQGQYSEMKRTDNRPPFKQWWSNGFDIVSQWQEIIKHL